MTRTPAKSARRTRATVERVFSAAMKWHAAMNERQVSLTREYTFMCATNALAKACAAAKKGGK